MAEEILVEYQLSRDNLCRGAVNEPVNARFRIETSDQFARQHPTTNCDIILVVDTSGSMDEPFGQGQSITKRAGVIEAAKMLVKSCQPRDRVSLICFDTQAYTELEDVPASETARINAGIDKIRTHSGMTSFGAAFASAARVAAKVKLPSKRVVFLTDGNDTTNKIKQAREENTRLAQAGVTVDCFGVGDDYNHQLMLSFTKVSSGEAHLLKTPREAQRLFEASLANAQQSLIRNAVLRLNVPRAFRDIEFYQTTPQQQDFSKVEGEVSGMKVYRVHLASLSQQGIYNFALHTAVDIPNDGSMNMLFANLHLEYDVPVKGLTAVKADTKVFLSFTDDPNEEVCRTDVDDIYITATLTRIEALVQSAAQKDDWKTVAALLNDMCRRAKQLGRRDLLSDYEKRLDTLRRNGKLSQADLNAGSQSTSQAQSQQARKKQSEDILGGGF